MEFRWVECDVTEPKGVLRVVGSPYWHDALNGGTWKLQYRVLEERLDSDDYRCKDWSEWRDVRIGDEEQHR